MFDRFVPASALVLLLAGCASQPERPRVVAEAYVGPATLNLRKELRAKSPMVGSLRHGERVEIVGRRRRFIKVRSEKGIEGWTDARQLLTPEQMANLHQQAREAGRYRSHGAATVYGSLNLHTEPNRQAPTLYTLKEGEKADVLEHRVVPRVAFEAPDLVPAPAPRSPARKTEKSGSRLAPPPAPPPPPPPGNWQQLSNSPFPTTDEPPKPVPTDDWTMLRLGDGRVGWSLTRLLVMAIPDEVAQYSEGHRITSYFSLGEVRDGGQVKHHWLWTTLRDGLQPYQFDSFRVFVWSLRRHRYETAYIERNLKGYFPVEVQPLKAASGQQGSSVPGFSLIIEDKDGQRYRRTYVFQGYLVRMVAKSPWSPPEQAPKVRPTSVQPAPAETQEQPFFSRLRRSLSAWRRRLFGKAQP